MQAPREYTSPFKQALILGANLGHIKIDKDFCKRAGLGQPLTASDSAQAGKQLQKHPIDIILVDDSLSDVPAKTFIKALRQDPNYRKIPVLMASLANSREAVLSAIEAGSSGYLIRPYSLAAFERQLKLASLSANYAKNAEDSVERAGQDLAEQRFDEAIAGFKRAEAELESADYHFERGIEEFKRERFDQAIQSFNKAVKINSLFVEAYFGLAKSWKAKGNLSNSRKCLRLAAEACVKARRFGELRQKFAEVSAAEPDRYNPFKAVGQEMLARAEYDNAVSALESALELDPKDGSLHLGLSKAFHIKRDPDKAVEHVLSSLAIDAGNPEAKAIFKRLAGHEFGETPAKKRERKRFPGLIPWMLNGVLYAAGIITELLHRRRRGYAS